MATLVKVRLFARLSDLAGIRETEIELAKEGTVTDVFRMLCSRYPELSDYKERLMFAVNAEYVDSSFTLKGGEEVALIPPVSGGDRVGSCDAA